ncbi:MAG: pyridoxal-phosphate-dependent aminotransferase family protein [Beduini sp.]
MKLFTVGPVEMYPETLAIRNLQIPYFRTDEFSKLMLENAAMLKELIGTNNDSKCAFITGSGSAAMEAVVSNCFGKSDKLLIINGGSFGERFVKICQIYNISYDEVRLNFGETLTNEKLSLFFDNKYTALLVNIDETSTGQLYDIHLLQDFCQKKKMKLVVDAISSFLSDFYEMDKMNIDCSIISSQKALALAPGLSMIVMNNTFYHEKVENREPVNLYLNIKEHVKNMERGQTPNTPAVGICFELHQRLMEIRKMGVENHVMMIHQRAEYFREKARLIGLSIPTYPLSNTLTPIIFDKGNAKEICNILVNEYNLMVTPNGGALADTVLRVGHIGNLKIEDFDLLLDKMKELI